MILNAHGGRRGGSQRSTRTIARALVQRGHAVVYACPSGAQAETLASDGMALAPLPRTRWLGGRLEQAGPANLVRVIRLVQRHEIEVLHTFQYGSYLLARAAAAATGAGHVHTVLGPLSPGHAFGPDDLVLAVSEAFARDAVKAGASPERVAVMPNRLDLKDFPPAPESSEPMVALISRLDGHLVAAAEHVLGAIEHVRTPGARFVVAGDGEALARLRTRPEAEWRGHVDDIRAIHREARVVVGVGRTLLEAMASGIPCVCVGPAGFAGVVEPATAESMARHNMSGRHAAGGPPEALAAALDRLLTDEAERARLRAWSRDWVRARYDIEQGTGLLEDTYARATLDLASRPRRLLSTAAQLRALTREKLRRTVARAFR